MAKLHLQVVTAERKVMDQEVDMVIAPGGAGELGILPRHIPLITTLKPGALRLLQGGEEEGFVVTGGFMEVRNAMVNDQPSSSVIVLADAAERVEEIDVARAEEARRRAEQRLAERSSGVDDIRAQAALLRAIARLRVAERYRTRHTPRQQ